MASNTSTSNLKCLDSVDSSVKRKIAVLWDEYHQQYEQRADKFLNDYLALSGADFDQTSDELIVSFGMDVARSMQKAVEKMKAVLGKSLVERVLSQASNGDVKE